MYVNIEIIIIIFVIGTWSPHFQYNCDERRRKKRERPMLSFAVKLKCVRRPTNIFRYIWWCVRQTKDFNAYWKRIYSDEPSPSINHHHQQQQHHLYLVSPATEYVCTLVCVLCEYHQRCGIMRINCPLKFKCGNVRNKLKRY
jgi:hypothetical protein